MHYFVLYQPHSDGIYVNTYPTDTTERFCDGQVSAFGLLGGVPQSILYDNTKLAAAKISGDGGRQCIRCSQNYSRTTCSRTGSDDPAGETTRVT